MATCLVVHLHTWTAYRLNAIIEAFKASVGRERLIPMGAPLDHVVSRRSPDGETLRAANVCL
jgi:hypothetical protein